MHDGGTLRCGPELRQIVRDASRALALLDADRLEELARACQALNRYEPRLSAQAREACADMAVFARVLDATRDNLQVMRRLRDLRRGQISYADSWQSSDKSLLEAGDGDN